MDPFSVSEEDRNVAWARLRLRLARLIWALLAALSLVLIVAAVPPAYAALRQVCRLPPDDCASLTLLSPSETAALAAAGVSLRAYALSMIALDVFFKGFWYVVGLIVFLRRSDDWLAILVSLWLITAGPATFSNTTLDLLLLANPAYTFPVRLASYSGEILTMAFFLLFPGGRFVPRWARWPALLLAVYHFIAYFFPETLSWWLEEANVLNTTFFIAMVSFFVYSQIYRYRFISTAIQRYQTRWIVTAAAVAISGLILTWLTVFFVAGGTGISVYLAHVITTLLMLLIPLSVAVAVLRYQLFDIVVIVRRTVIYGILTTALAAVYFGSVVILENLSRAITGQDSPLTIVLSTLFIAVLFSPLRRGIQRIIDRRFYRRRYDAEERLSAFANVVRSEVNLEPLATGLVQVIEDSLQPSSVLLWLKEESR